MSYAKLTSEACQEPSCSLARNLGLTPSGDSLGRLSQEAAMSQVTVRIHQRKVTSQITHTIPAQAPNKRYGILAMKACWC